MITFALTRAALLAILPHLIAALQAVPASNGTHLELVDQGFGLTHAEDEAKMECIDDTRQLCDSDNEVDLIPKAVLAGKHLKAMRTSCRGAKWDGVACKKLLEEYRHVTVHHLKHWLAADNSHLFRRSLRMCSPAPVHHFRSGGGFRANIPCRKEGLSAIFFRHIWKAGGLAIRFNLGEQAVPKFNASVVMDTEWNANRRCQQYNQLKKESHPTLFTFVRDPIAKFIAGYKEMNSRELVPTLRGHHAGSIDHAKAFLDMVFHGTCENGHILLQSQSFINDACQSNFDFIGKLEHFEQDWAKLSEVAMCDKEPLGWPLDEHHDSEVDDSYKFEDAMKATLNDNDHALLKALCWWVLPDHAIFDYDLPPECAADENLKLAIASL